MSTSLDLSGKVALITGGNGGIGLGIAKGLLDAGASIAVSYTHLTLPTPPYE